MWLMVLKPKFSHILLIILLPFTCLASKAGDMSAGDMSAEILDKSIKGAEEGFFKLASKSLEREPSLCIADSCCVVSYITSKMLFVANVGNCRAVSRINSGDKTQ